MSTPPLTSFLQDDATYVWHPFTQAATGSAPLPIVKAQGAYVYSEDGSRYLDAISGWWTNVHGHGHPVLAQTLKTQAETLDHIQFAGATHPQAVKLARQLAEYYPSPPHWQTPWRSFFSDNGSTAVEVALKIAYQYCQQTGQHHRKRFLALEGGYHGDTVGAMSVGFGSGFYQPFEPLCFPVDRLPIPTTYLNDSDIEAKEAAILAQWDAWLAKHGSQTAAFIGEPLLQGASGMRMTRPQFWQAIVSKLKATGILVIFDEVLTGFGRTGKLFAAEHLTPTLTSSPPEAALPDLVCLSKGITGGTLPMGLTLVSPHLYNAFLGPDFSTAFAHGHSYTANPITCAVANTSLGLFKTEATLDKIAALNQVHRAGLAQLAQLPHIHHPRLCGLVAAMEIGQPQTTYTHTLREQLYQTCLAENLLVRPLGNTLYLLPPTCLAPTELADVYDRLANHILPKLML